MQLDVPQSDYRQISNIRHTLVGNKIADRSDVVGASSVNAAPTTSSFSTKHMASIDWDNGKMIWDEKKVTFWDLVHLMSDILR